MSLTKEKAIALGIKIMKDISFLFDESDLINANYIDKSDTPVFPDDSWLISFQYGKEDYGKNVGAHLTIDNKSKIGTEISFRNGFISLGYDEEKGKYFVKEKRP